MYSDESHYCILTIYCPRTCLLCSPCIDCTWLVNNNYYHVIYISKYSYRYRYPDRSNDTLCSVCNIYIVLSY